MKDNKETKEYRCRGESLIMFLKTWGFKLARVEFNKDNKLDYIFEVNDADLEEALSVYETKRKHSMF